MFLIFVSVVLPFHDYDLGPDDLDRDDDPGYAFNDSKVFVEIKKILFFDIIGFESTSLMVRTILLRSVVNVARFIQWPHAVPVTTLLTFIYYILHKNQKVKK